MDENVHVQCIKCNKYMSGNGVEYAIALEKQYGYGIIQKIAKAKANNKQIFTIPLLREEFVRQSELLRQEAKYL